MTLHAPFIITSRLLAGLKIGDGTISIDYDGEDKDGRTIYRYYVDVDRHGTHEGNDLKSGCGGGTLQEGMESFMSFLYACAEGGENADLFPPWVREWAEENKDEIGMLEVELGEAVLIEE